MSRPVKKGVDYFPHDVNALHDGKIESLVRQCGATGYAVYFAVLEKIYKEGNDKYSEDFKYAVADGLRISVDELDLIVMKATEIGLFSKAYYTSKKRLYSSRLSMQKKQIEFQRSKARRRVSLKRSENCSLEQSSCSREQQAKSEVVLANNGVITANNENELFREQPPLYFLKESKEYIDTSYSSTNVDSYSVSDDEEENNNTTKFFRHIPTNVNLKTFVEKIPRVFSSYDFPCEDNEKEMVTAMAKAEPKYIATLIAAITTTLRFYSENKIIHPTEWFKTAVLNNFEKYKNEYDFQLKAAKAVRHKKEKLEEEKKGAVESLKQNLYPSLQ